MASRIKEQPARFRSQAAGTKKIGNVSKRKRSAASPGISPKDEAMAIPDEELALFNEITVAAARDFTK